MKTYFCFNRSTSLTKYFAILFSMLFATVLAATSETGPETSSLILSNLAGSVWVESDGNGTDNGESGPSDVLVILFDSEEDTIVAQTNTLLGKYEFNGISPGKYYIKIDKSAFQFGGALIGLQSCLGANDANDMVDNDDNGSDTDPNDVLCSPFDLSNADPMVDVSIEYIDFCFYYACDEQNIFAKPTCEAISSSDIFCDMTELDNFCAVMPVDSTEGNQPSPLCDGVNESENISWLAFIAADGIYTLSISASDCTVGNIGQKGIQVGLYKDCSFEEPAFCSDQCTEGTINISSSFLVSGQVYYMYINGCDGNVCNYQIDVTGNPTVPPLLPEDVCIFSGGDFLCEDLSYCPNSDILFMARGVNITGSFTWSITTISGAPYTGDQSPITTTDELILSFPSEGVYEVCLTKVDNGCDDQAWSGSFCQNVTIDLNVPMPMDEDFGEASVCEEAIDDFNISVFANQDPNGDGDFGWNALIPDYMLGVNKATVYTVGCSYEQQFTLSTFEPSPVEDVLVVVCEDDLPIQVDYLTFTLFTFAGQPTISFDNLLLQNSQDQNGCDSIINLTVEKLSILLGGILDPICTMDGINLQFNYISDLSTDIAFLEFVWKDPLGNILPFGTDPTTVLAPFESGNGEYTLEININKNGVSCTYSYSTFIDIASFLPPTPTISGPSIVCEGETNAEYTAEGDGEETTFIWSFPNDVNSATISGAMNEIINIDWTGSNGGEIVAIGQNICGQSNQISYGVEVIPKTTPEFSIDTSICIDNPATVDFFGTGINLTDYTWDFDGGTIISGNGMGPYQISWDNEGVKFVSLITTDVNGCSSNLVENTISVKAPLAPTNVICLPSIGEVVFTWQIPVGVSGFEVNVLSGQSGGVFTATSFTVSNLDEGEEVTIELLTKPEDTICGQFVSTIVSCTALDCVPPIIELSADQEVCVNGENITIDADITSGESGTGVFSGPGIIDPANGIFDPSEANLGINTILYAFTSDVAGCTGSKTISIEVFNVPIASYNQNLDTMCITGILDLEYTGTLNPQSFDWDFDGGLGSGLLTNQQVTFDSPGLKTISLQVTKNNCPSNIATSIVFVESELEGVIIQCDTAGSDFVAFSWNTINGVSLYEIKVDNNPSFFSPNNTITIDNLDEEQEVAISVTSLSKTSCPGSTSSSLCTTTMTVAVEDQLLSQIKIYPNPVTDHLFFEGLGDQRLIFNLYSIIGNSVKTGMVSSQAVDLSSITSGIYILRVSDEKRGVFKDFKVVKE